VNTKNETNFLSASNHEVATLLLFQLSSKFKGQGSQEDFLAALGCSLYMEYTATDMLLPLHQTVTLFQTNVTSSEIF